jgi:hypothetical protein
VLEHRCQNLTAFAAWRPGAGPRQGTRNRVPVFVAPPFAPVAFGDAGDVGALSQPVLVLVIRAHRPARVAASAIGRGRKLVGRQVVGITLIVRRDVGLVLLIVGVHSLVRPQDDPREGRGARREAELAVQRPLSQTGRPDNKVLNPSASATCRFTGVGSPTRTGSRPPRTPGEATPSREPPNLLLPARPRLRVRFRPRPAAGEAAGGRGAPAAGSSGGGGPGGVKGEVPPEIRHISGDISGTIKPSILRSCVTFRRSGDVS